MFYSVSKKRNRSGGERIRGIKIDSLPSMDAVPTEEEVVKLRIFVS